ncbi:ROK family protein, partial [Levilinea saccharolytica]
MARYGCVEAGGTKFICAVADEAGNIEAEVRIPTTTPEETLGQALRFFQTQHGLGDAALRSLGVACFGPVDLQTESPTYGMITATPKAGWRMTPVVRFLQEGLGVPVGFDTDVNGAALAEGVWGAGK